MSTVHLIFYIQNEGNVEIILFQTKPNKEFTFLHTKTQEIDNYCNCIAGARIIIDKLNDQKLQSLSITNKKHEAKVDYDRYNYAIKKIWNNASLEEQVYMKYLRSPQNYTWPNYLNDAPLWNDDVEANFYYFISITKNDLEIIQKNNSHLKTKLLNIHDFELWKNNVQKYLNKQTQVVELFKNKDYLRKNGKNIAFFNFKDNGYGQYCAPGYFLDVVTYYNGIFRRKYDNWTVYSVVQGEYPTKEELSKLDLIIMPGSANCSYNKSPWILKVESILKEAYQEHKQIRILGICFGLQITIQALGGLVEGMEHSFCYGNSILHYNIKAMKEFKVFDNLELKEKAIINQAHGDEVTQYGDLFVNIAGSQKCKNEVLISKDQRMLGFQGHPEYSSHVMRLLGIENRLSSGYHFEQLIKQSNIKKQDPINLEICKRFLRFEQQ